MKGGSDQSYSIGYEGAFLSIALVVFRRDFLSVDENETISDESQRREWDGSKVFYVVNDDTITVKKFFSPETRD